MAILLKVEWVDRADEIAAFAPCQSIRQIGGSSRECQWKHSREQAIQAIERNEFAYYIQEETEVLQLEIGLTQDGQKFLKTNGEGTLPAHLLNLPPYPPAKIANH